MIRFQPDTPLQALTRFFDMAAPDANVYLEIAAPDLRMAAIALLALAAILAWRRLQGPLAPTLSLLLVLLLSSVIWLATTGNGRYFLPMLICAGPVAIGLVCRLPLSRSIQLTLGLLLLMGQVFVLVQQPPWSAWSWTNWEEAPYFEVKLGPQETAPTATTYVTASGISYSLIAPQFPPNARWVNLGASGGTPRDAKWMDAFLRRASAAGPVRLLVPSLPTVTLPDGRPNADILAALDKLIAPHNLRIQGDCHLITSLGQVRLQGLERKVREGRAPPVGFWSCPMVYEERNVGASRQRPPGPVLKTFERLGELCPRFFAKDQVGELRIPAGWVRHYDASDTRVYVMDNGEVWYKFWRSLNAVFVGKVDDVIAGKVTVDCTQVRGHDGGWKSGSQ